ncbi:hypothetical protein [Okeania sp. SIO3I5]|nr:hypothetical protein [Okeania sp. SIO3I5]
MESAGQQPGKLKKQNYGKTKIGEYRYRIIVISVHNVYAVS